MSWSDAGARAILHHLFQAGLAAVDPLQLTARYLPDRPRGRCVVVGAGKASAAMAAAVDAAWPDVALSGIVVTADGHGLPDRPEVAGSETIGRITVIEAGHPVPDTRSEAAARQMMAAVSGLGPDDLVLALISGGGSALAALPAGDISLADQQIVTRALLLSGAPIAEINLIRRHLSAIKGGGLARAAQPAQLVTLLISDVPGDDPATIASGPTIPAAPDWQQFQSIIDRHDIALPPAITAYVKHQRQAPVPQMDIHPELHMVARPVDMLQAAATAAQALGITPLILGDAIEGEARDLGIMLAGMAQSVQRHGLPLAPPAVLLSGGETTVTIRDGADGRIGRGGRNGECILSLLCQLGGRRHIWALAADSDGIDGSSDAAGAMVAPDSMTRAARLGLDPEEALIRHDSHGFFAALGDLVVTGPTHTNVNDFRAILIGQP